MKSHNHIRPSVLVAPLDWGLGHTTRCIPVITALLQKNVPVILAGTDVQKAIFNKEFPQCRFLQLPGYGITLSKSKRKFIVKILEQMPRLLKTIAAENRWLKRIAQQEKICGVISDNRFGLFANSIPTVFITHQLLIKTGMGAVADRMLQQLNYRFINRFETCWVPDFSATPGLAGVLSHPARMPRIACTYVGSLSRMQPLPGERVPGHILIMLSGPEPQRTMFEQILFDQLQHFSGTATVVRGLPAGGKTLKGAFRFSIFDHLPKEELNKEMCRAQYIICRSGYSSIMDISAVGAKSILVPTPGQTEQEYLAETLSAQGFCIASPQHDFDLMQLLQRAGDAEFNLPGFHRGDRLLPAVNEFLERCGFC